MFSNTDCSGLALDPACVNVVIYHDKCWDGFGAAWAVWRRRGDAATYIPRNHSPQHKAADDILEQLVGKHVLVVDYCFPLDTTLKIMRVAANFAVLDHHVSAEADMTGVPARNKVFTMAQSGATLAFNFMWGEHVEVPMFLRYVEDGDLWRKQLAFTEEFRLALATLPFEFGAWDTLIGRGDKGVATMIECGKPRREMRDECVAAAAKAAQPCVITGFPHVKARAVNASNWVSEVGAAIVADDTDVALVWSATAKDGALRVAASLRSKVGGVNVADIARTFGGGGHAAASGFGCALGDLVPHVMTLPVSDT